MADHPQDKTTLFKNKYCAGCDSIQPIENKHDTCVRCGTRELANPPQGIKDRIREGLASGKVFQRID